MMGWDQCFGFSSGVWYFD